jgi:hypothetical protein
MIRQDAREEVIKGGVTVSLECCGKRRLRVHYQVHGGPHVLRDGYVLLLETTRGHIDTISVSESLDEEERTEGIVHRDASFSYELVRLPHNAGWGSTVSFGSGDSTYNGPGRPSIGLGSSAECHSPSPAPSGFYRAMLMVVRNARRHVSSLPVAPSRRYC